MTRSVPLCALALLMAAPASADIFEIAAANRASGATDTPATVPYIHTADVTVSGRKGDEVQDPVTARLRIDPSQPPGERVSVLSRSDADSEEMNTALADLIEQIEENDLEDQRDGFWCSARDRGDFAVTPANYAVIGESDGIVRLEPTPDRRVQLMMGEDDLDELDGQERGIAKRLADRLEGELHLDASDGQMRGMAFRMTRPLRVMLIAKVKAMDVAVECDRAPNGYPYVSRFSMHVTAGAFGRDMVNDMEIVVGELTPVGSDS
ncbi:MAG: hypothetical protein WBG08_03555 [Litorimonas sp.]